MCEYAKFLQSIIRSCGLFLGHAPKCLLSPSKSIFRGHRDDFHAERRKRRLRAVRVTCGCVRATAHVCLVRTDSPTTEPRGNA